MEIKQINVLGQTYDIRDAFGRALIASEFNPENEYVSGDFCIYSNNLYKCLSSTTGSWDSSIWSSTTIADNLGGGGGDIEGLIERTIVSYEGNNSSIGGYAFYSYSSLQSVSFPQCSVIGEYAFYRCTSLQSVSFPSCTDIGNSAFNVCISLQSISFPSCTWIGNAAFSNCTSLKSVNFPSCTNITMMAFYCCTLLQSTSFPMCSQIGRVAFYSCTSLQSINFPQCSCINSSAFYNCTKLSAIYLLASSICTLSNSNAFANTPISKDTYLGYFGSIYVPSSLVDSYKTATNWTYYADRITSYIEE